MTAKAKQMWRVIGVQILVVLFFAILLCCGCATPQERCYWVPGHYVREVDISLIHEMAGKDVSAVYAENSNTIFVDREHPSQYYRHETLHVVGYKHGEEWSLYEQEPRKWK